MAASCCQYCNGVFCSCIIGSDGVSGSDCLGGMCVRVSASIGGRGCCGFGIKLAYPRPSDTRTEIFRRGLPRFVASVREDVLRDIVNARGLTGVASTACR